MSTDEQVMLHALMERIPAGLLVLDSECSILRMNHRMRVLGGLLERDYVGLPLVQVLPSLAGMLAPELQALCDDGEPFLERMIAMQGEDRAVGTWGECWCSVSGERLGFGRSAAEGVLVTVFDVSSSLRPSAIHDATELQALMPTLADVRANQQTEKALRQSEARLLRVFDSTADGLVEIDASGRIALVNRRMEELFGYPREALLGQPIEMLIPERYRHHHPKHRQDFFAQPSQRDMAQRRELYARRQDGSEFPVEIGLNPMQTEDGLRVLATIADVTTQQQAKRALEKALSEKTALLDEVHHRVKNNLQVISSLLRLQARQASDEARQELETSQNRVRSMALIHQLLYERSDYSEVDLCRYLARLCGLLGDSLNRGREGVRLNLQVPDKPLALDLQRTVPFGMIVNELVTNAFKHAFTKGKDSTGSIDVVLSQTGGDTGVLEVMDDGGGLPEGFGLNGSASLGFQLVSMFVDQMSGSVMFEREPRTCFRVRFPLTVGEVE